jgi:hypothetical protein
MSDKLVNGKLCIIYVHPLPSATCLAFSATCLALSDTCLAFSARYLSSLSGSYVHYFACLVTYPLCPRSGDKVIVLWHLSSVKPGSQILYLLSDICPARLSIIVPLQPCLISVQPNCQILYLCSPVWFLSSQAFKYCLPLQPCLISVQPGC